MVSKGEWGWRGVIQYREMFYEYQNKIRKKKLVFLRHTCIKMINKISKKYKIIIPYNICLNSEYYDLNI